MLAKVVGIKSVEYTKKDGKEVKGASVYILKDPTSRDGEMDGQIAESVWISGNCLKMLKDIVIGAEYDFRYEFDGRYSYLDSIVPA